MTYRVQNVYFEIISNNHLISKIEIKIAQNFK